MVGVDWNILFIPQYIVSTPKNNNKRKESIQTKTLWITGASSGLGLTVAQAFARGGWRVIAGARSFEDNSTDSDGIVRFKLDVTSEASCEGFVEKALQISPAVDVLVCAAAILNLGSCELTSRNEYARVMETNFLGLVKMVSLTMPVMRQQKCGKIFLFSSINGLLGIPFQSAYTASKHAIEGYAECLSMEAKAYGIQVCLIEPGDHRGGSNHTRLHASCEGESSPYHTAYENACRVIEHDESNGLYPDKLGQKVFKTAQKRKMCFRLRIAKPDQHLAVYLHKFLPEKLNGAILRSYYKIKK